MGNNRESWKIWSARVLLVYAAIAFVWSLSSYVGNQIRFRDVESWPTVTAHDVQVVPKQIEITSTGRYGGLTTRWIEVFTVDFSYVLDGVTFDGSYFTPDNRVPDSALLPAYRGFPWLAYYSPRDPSLAVLVPFPYRGTSHLTVVVVSGLLVLTALCRWGVWPNGQVRKDGLTAGIGRHWFGCWCAIILGFSIWMDARESRLDSSIEETKITPEMEQWLSDISFSYYQASPGSSLPDFVLKEDEPAIEGVDEVNLEPLPELPLQSLRAVWERDKIRKLFHQPHVTGGYDLTIWVSGILLALYLVLFLITNRMSRR